MDTGDNLAGFLSLTASALFAKSRGSFSNTFEVFQSDCLARKECILNKLLADVVVHPPLIVGRALAHSLQVLFGVLGSLALQKSANTLGTAANSLDGFTAVGTAFAVGCKLDNAEVNTENAVRLNQRRVRNADRRHQVEVAIDKGQITFALLKSKKAALVLTAHERQFQTTLYRPDAYLPLVNIPPQDTAIKGNRPRGQKRALSALVQLVGVSDFANSTNNNLCGQPRRSTLSRVLTFVERILPESLVCPGPCAQAVTDGVGGLHRSLQGVRLLRRYEQFDLGSKFHYTDIIPAITQACQCQTKPIGQFLPRVNASWGLLARVRERT